MSVNQLAKKPENKALTAPVPAASAQTKRRLPFALEVVSVFVIAMLAFAAYSLFSNSPNITLIFDSTGYLAIVESWLRITNLEFAGKVAAYALHGFDENQRLLLVQQMGSACEILKSGPLLPLIVGGAYAICHATPAPVHWQIGAFAMMAVQALTVTFVWLIARQNWGSATAKLSLFIALSYCGIMLNAGRLMSEIPASFAVVFASWTLLYVARKHTSDEVIHSSSLRLIARGILLGFSLVLLTLARSALLLMPLLLIPTIILLSRFSGNTIRRSQPLLIGAVAGFIGFISPWILCEKILTGRPSIIIDRYGAYNLFTGLDVNNDAFDVLPGECVSHPERYKASTGQAITTAVQHAAAAPVAFVDMILRKPARLIDSPWNDFQVPVLGLPWPGQVWLHQWLMLMAGFGLIKALKDAFANRRNFLGQLAPTVLGAVVLYHFVNCAFITMRRYMVTAMPEIVLLAAYGVCASTKANKQGTRLRLVQFAAVTAAVPTALFLGDFCSSAHCHLMQTLALNIGVTYTAAIVSASLAALLALWFFVAWNFASACGDVNGTTVHKYLNSEYGIEPAWIRHVWRLGAFIAVIVCFTTSNHQLRNLEYTFTLKQPEVLTIHLSKPAVVPDARQRSFLLIDAYRDGNEPDPLKTLACTVNNVQAVSSWKPLFSMDLSQRENMVYERVFGEAAGREPENFRQWWVAEVPSEAIAARSSSVTDSASDDLNVQFFNRAAHRPLFVAADFFPIGPN